MALTLGVLLLVRAALPIALRRVLVSQASQALHARVEVGDVDLALWRGGVALEDVAVRPADTPAAKPAGAPDDRLISWKRLAVEMRWLPLFRRTIELRSVALDGPRVALDRLPGGDLNLMALVPAAPSTTTTSLPAAEKAPAPGPGWGVGVDHLVLRAGRLRFRDLMLRNFEPVEVSIDNVEVRDFALAPGLYGEPAHIQLVVEVDRGLVRVDGRLAIQPDGLSVDAAVKAKRLPVQRTRVYIPGVGWSDLRGELAAAIETHFATGTRNEVSGTVILSDITVRVPGLDEPALAWQRLLVRVHPLDMIRQHAAVQTVDLRGAALVVRPRGVDLLPLLARAVTGDTTAPASAPAPEEKPAPPEEAKPWHWSVASLRVADSHVHVLGPESSLEVGVALGAHGVAGDGGEPAPVTLLLTVGEGSVGVDGTLRVAPPGVEGTVKIDQLNLPEIAAAAGALPPQLLQVGRLAADLQVAVGSAAPPGDVRVRGTLALAEPWLAATDQHEFAIGAKTIQMAIDEIDVPGVLAAEPGAAPPGAIRVRLAGLDLDAPYVQLTRTADGLALPSFAAAPGPPEAAPPSPPAETPPAAEVHPAAPGTQIDVGALRLTGGRVYVTDRTVTPFYTAGLDPLDAEVDALHWPDLALGRLHLVATSDEKGKIQMDGALALAGGRIEVHTHEVALQPFNPYATTYSSYSIARGRLSLSTKASFGKRGYAATNAVTLHDFDLASRGGDSLFQEQFGIPLSMVLALLRDVSGNIVLDIPVAADPEGTKIPLLTIIGGALRRALVNALASPLKLAGLVFGEEQGQALAPAPIAFRPGRDALAPGAEDQVAKLAALLASRPGLGVTLQAAPSPGDVRWLREQALREEFAGRQGVLGTLKNLPERGVRERVRTALEARAKDEKGALDAGDAAALERWLAERPPLPPEQLRALAEARLVRVETLLREQHGIGSERVARREPAAETAAEPPAVRLELGAAGAR